MAKSFVSRARHDEFVEKIEAVLAEFPEIADRMKRAYDEDDDPTRWSNTYEDEKDYDPNGFVYRLGWVLAVYHVHEQGWEECSWIHPTNQPVATTVGIVEKMRDAL